MKKIILGIFMAVMLVATSAKADLPMQSFAPLVKKTSPSVVNIYTKQIVKERVQAINPFFNDPFFSQFFNAPQFGGQMRERVASSLGSGVFVDEAGLIATNSHVVKDSTEINVVLTDGREFPATKMLVDPRTDLAILKIDAKGEKFPVLALADSDAVEVGDIVLAIGNPFGVGQTVTSGIVSGVARSYVGVSDYSFFIQTDAAINPGNSGGALVDSQGRLIGINTAIVSNSGGSLGIGFAIPANMVKTVIDAAHTGNKVIRPWTGMSGQAVTKDMIESLGLTKAQGALTNHVYKGGPADKAGIKTGDVILAVNGKEIHDPAALKFRLGTVAIGGDINLTVFRAGKTLDVTMKAEAAPYTPAPDVTKLAGNQPLSGAVVANISPGLSEEMSGIPVESGVVVQSVEGGIATRLGLQRGDVVSAINGKKVTSVDQLQNLLKTGSQQWQLQVQRGNQMLNLAIR